MNLIRVWIKSLIRIRNRNKVLSKVLVLMKVILVGTPEVLDILLRPSEVKRSRSGAVV